VPGRRGSGAPGRRGSGAPGRRAPGVQAGRRGAGRRAPGAGRGAASAGRPPPHAAECRHELGCRPRRALVSRVGRAQRTRMPLASRPASRVKPLVRPRSGHRRGNSPNRAAGGWRLASHTGRRISGHTGRRISGRTGRRISDRTGRRISGRSGRTTSGHTGRRISGPIGRRTSGHTTGRTSSRRSRAMPRGRTCRPSGTALVDRQRRLVGRMRMWPKAWPHRHVASPPMPGPHDDVALPPAVWLHGCAMERLQRRNDRASARLRGWWAISYELSNAKPRECSPPPRKLDVRAFPPERPSPGRRLCSGVATSLCSCPKQARWGRQSPFSPFQMWPHRRVAILGDPNHRCGPRSVRGRRRRADGADLAAERGVATSPCGRMR
jgi:hypothetical protein